MDDLSESMDAEFLSLNHNPAPAEPLSLGTQSTKDKVKNDTEMKLPRAP